MRNKYIGFVGVAAEAAFLLGTSQVDAQAVGPGGHVYETFIAGGIDWNSADAAANATQLNTACGLLSGHLATVTSLAEDQFVYNEWINTSLGPEAWIGGFQPAGSPEPAGGWIWINGEGLLSLGYTNWLGGEPNDVGGGEGHLAIALGGNFGWNDEGNLNNINGYIVEYDCNEVDIDIKFCSNPNAHNCRSGGVLPVTIFGSADLDVLDIDLASLQLCRSDTDLCAPAGSVTDLTSSIDDRGTAGDRGTADCVRNDDGLDVRNPDGFADLDAGFDKFAVSDLLDVCAEGSKGESSVPLFIQGSLLDGTPIISIPVGTDGIDQLVRQNR
jgi:hypothetical protein